MQGVPVVADASRPQRGRERFALYAYPVLWLAPALLLFALVPEVRLVPCQEARIAATTGTEGSCLVSDGNANEGVYHVANSGHALAVPGYSVRMVGPPRGTGPGPRRLPSASGWP